MKKIFKILIWLGFITVFLLIYFYFGFNLLLMNLILLNIVAYFLRSILIDIFQSLIKNLFARYIVMIIINIIWLIFTFWLLFVVSPIY
ncbi:MAG: hypothetical protein JSV62_04345, partial [Promethearchaeota archaeon]